MKRAKPYKIILVIAVIVAGVICMTLPQKQKFATSAKDAIATSDSTSTNSNTTYPIK